MSLTCDSVRAYTHAYIEKGITKINFPCLCGKGVVKAGGI